MTEGRAGCQRILMTVDAVGGVWRYAMDLAAGLREVGVDTVFAGFGPRPAANQLVEAEALGRLVWCDAPLDWTAEEETEVRDVSRIIDDLAWKEQVDLLHLNLPSQAAGLKTQAPVLVVSHSCVATWFQAVRGHTVPREWQWQLRLNQEGLQRADVVVAPSRSHANQLQQVYGGIGDVQVVHNATWRSPSAPEKADLVFAAGRWWDDGKNGAVLDAAAPHLDWPLVLAGTNRGPNGQYLPFANVSCRGELPHHEAMALLDKAAVFVSPSLYEPFGLAALEAARSSSALVLADIPTYRELWDGAALFADPKSAASVADAINRLSRDGQLRRELGSRAQERSRSFTPGLQAASMMRLYTRLLSQSPVLAVAE